MPNKEEQSLRLPPQAVEAEQATLGCMLIEKEAVPKAIQILSQVSFYKSANGKIFNSIVELFDKSKAVDTISVIDQLKKSGDLESVGGAYYITGLSAEAPSAENVEYYAKIVQEKYILRKIIRTSVDLSSLAYDAKDDVTDILDKAEQVIFSLSQGATRGGFQHVEPILHDVLDKFGTNKDGSLTGIPSGVYGLDDLLSGFQKSDMVIVAARPSMGKTALALCMARNAAIEYGHSVGLFSLEMANRQLVERMITAEAKVDSHLVRTGRLPKKDWKKLAQAAGPLSEAKIYVDDSPGLSIMEIRAKARRLKAEKDIDVLFIDYLQLINASTRSENRQQEISLISRSLKALAKELNIPIVVLSQLSRQPENRTNHRPIMSDLRESGAIEQDADVVLFIFRKFVYSKNDEDKGIGEIIIGKHRNGPTGVVPVAFIDKYAWFGDLELTHAQSVDSEIPM